MDAIAVGHGVVIPPDEIDLDFVRGGGPGGQHANTSATTVQLRFDLAGSPSLSAAQRARARARLAHRLTDDGILVIDAREHRSQTRNREAAIARLITLLGDALAPPAPPRRATRPSRRARQRRLDAKRRTAEKKRDRRAPEP